MKSVKLYLTEERYLRNKRAEIGLQTLPSFTICPLSQSKCAYGDCLQIRACILFVLGLKFDSTGGIFWNLDCLAAAVVA